MKYFIYTDGGCINNPGKGGLAYVVYSDLKQENRIDEFVASYVNTTNNRMELMACIFALQKYGKCGNVSIYTDSKYVKDGITEWILSWKQTNFNNNKIKNIDLWKKLDKLNNENIKWEWVRGHTDSVGNIEVDKLANSAARCGVSGEFEENDAI